MVFSPKMLFFSSAIKLTGPMSDVSFIAPQHLWTPCFFLHQSQSCNRTPPSFWGDNEAFLCTVGNIFSSLRRQKSIVLSHLTAFATFEPHPSRRCWEKKPQKYRREANFTTLLFAIQMPLPSVFSHSSHRTQEMTGVISSWYKEGVLCFSALWRL